MSISRKLIAALREGLLAEANAADAPKMQAYMKSAMPFYGVKAPVLRRVCKEMFARYPLESFQDWYDTVRALWRGAKFREERYCSIELSGAQAYRDHRTLEVLPLYEEMIVTGAWWDLVDAVAPNQLAELLRRYPGKMKPMLRKWAKGEDMWKRRAAILSQLKFKRDTDLALLYQCIEPSLGSKEFFLQKAIGWALRNYAWHDLDEVLRYVSANESRLSPLSKREALKNQHSIAGR